MLALKIAVRNLLRHWRRSLITGGAIALGLAMLMFSSAGTDGMTDNMIENATGSQGGHVVVQGVGWQVEREAEIAVPDTPAVIDAVRTAVPDAHIVKRVFLDGLLTSPDGAAGVMLSAVEPGSESVVNDLHERVVEGTYLDDDPRGIVIGRNTADSLDVAVGDKVVLMTQGPDGVESRLFRIKGIFEFGIDMLDGTIAHVRIEPAQEMLGLGTDATQISLHLPRADDTPMAEQAVKAAVGDRSVEVLPWTEALPKVAEYVASEQAEIFVIYGVLFLMVGMGIVNTVLMSVMERMREFAVMKSLGSSPWLLCQVVLVEGAVLGLVSSLVGIGLGLAIVVPLMEKGVDMSALIGGGMDVAGVPLDLVIHFAIDPTKIAAFAGFTTLLTIGAAIYPAWQAATVRPTEHMHHR